MPRRRPRPWNTERTDNREPSAPRRTSGRTCMLDLHGYDVLTALDVARLTLREAYANGYQSVEIIHGSREVTSPVAGGEGRGAIKWELRAMLDRGDFDAYVASGEKMEASLRLRLRSNPQSRSEQWTALPSPSRG